MNSTPAFPQPYNGALHDAERTTRQGMTLRDYFAAAAMQGLLAHPECDYTPMTAQAQAQAASDAYAMADAMLKARGKS